MSDVIISVEGLGKRYRISHQGEKQRYTTLRDVIAQKAKGLFTKIGERRAKNGDAPLSPLSSLTSDLRPLTSAKSSEDFWALKDVSFEVKRGEVVGIIGRNGAGKSTLLKILSRITEPTTGRVHLRGRVASLLEVGTGFHPELTGRENVFLNGAILGMSRVEIRKKFDEIVAFAEVEKFLDTPVKRYSSGMYVRLAFAVAAHLEPEILIVDEVLAVGDTEFQKKCLGKMSEVAKGGRTVLFVSHNMAAVLNLTKRAVVLSHGKVAFDNITEKSIAFYHELVQPQNKWSGHGRHASILDVSLLNAQSVKTTRYDIMDSFRVNFEVATDGSTGMSVDLHLCDNQGNRIAFWSTAHFHNLSLPTIPGRYRCDLSFPPIYLAAGKYWLEISTAITNIKYDHVVERALGFEVVACNPNRGTWNFLQTHNYGNIALYPDKPPQMTELTVERPASTQQKFAIAR